MRKSLVFYALALIIPNLIFGQIPDGQSTNYVAKRVYLKYPSSFVNLTSETWRVNSNNDRIITALKFQSVSHIGQIFSIRFIKPNGDLEAMLVVGILERNLEIEMFNSDMKSVLNKPMINQAINQNEQNLAMGINFDTRRLWYRIGGNVSSDDVFAEIDATPNVSSSEIVVTLGGGGQSMIGCVSLVAVSVGDGDPIAEVNAIESQDIDNCPDQDECTTRDCNTGRCRLLEVATCDCYGTELTGPNCRKPTSAVKLRNNDDDSTSFIRFSPWESLQNITRIAIDFKFGDPDAEEGILVYAETVTGAIFKVIVVGTKGKVFIDSTNLIDFTLKPNIGFHTFIVRIEERHLSIFVDEYVDRATIEDPLYFSTIQFGAAIPKKEGATEVGLTGCVKNVYVDYMDVIDLMENNDQRLTVTRIQPCVEGDDLFTDINGAALFPADPIVEGKVLSGDLFPNPASEPDTKPKDVPPEQCEHSQEFQCQNAGKCRRINDDDFECFCRDGYIGRFCQFSILPKSCAEAFDFHKLPNGPTKIDVDGSGKMEPSIAMCVDGETRIPHDFKNGTIVRDSSFQNHSLFVISYRDFKLPQLYRNIKNSKECSQAISYRCNKAPLRFQDGHTWFVTAQNASAKVRQIGSNRHSCSCLDTGCRSAEKCNCDSGSITEDSGIMTGENAGITEIVTLVDEADVHADINLGELKCSGYEDEGAIRFVEKSVELPIYEWHGESLEFQFRTGDSSGTILHISGHSDVIRVRMIDGNTVQIQHLDTVRNVESQKRINDSDWHHIVIEVIDDEIRFTIDNSHILIPVAPYTVLEGYVTLSDATDGIIGCFRSVRVHDVPIGIIDMATLTNNQGIKTSCNSQCTARLCQNGAKCHENFVSETPYCRCAFPEVHSGKTCEIDINSNTSVSFHGGHLRIDNLTDPLTGSVFFSFRTDQQEALLFFAHDENNNFLQIHLSEEVNITLTLNNLNIVSRCTVRATPGTEFGDMSWLQIGVTHTADSSQLQVDDAVCTIRNTRSLSLTPIQRLLGAQNSAIVRLPIGISAAPNPDPFTVIFVGDVDTGVHSNDGSIILAPRYESPIRRFVGCIRGFRVDSTMIDMREKTLDLPDPSLVRIGCEVGCETVSCANGGHCSVAWTNYDPTATKTSCDCSRTSYAGATCTLDEGIHITSGSYLSFNIGTELSRTFVDKSSIPQLFKFAFSSSIGSDVRIIDKHLLATVDFLDGRQIIVEINPNRTINVAISNERRISAEVLNFDGDFADGYRHFVVIQTNPSRATAVMVDSLRRDFAYKSQDRNLDLFKSINIRIGAENAQDAEDTEEEFKIGFDGCVSNVLVDLQRGASLSFSPIAYYLNPNHHLHQFVSTIGSVESKSCAEFRVPNSLPVYQNPVRFPAWETDFRRQIYRGEIEKPETRWIEENSELLFWILIFISAILIAFTLVCCQFLCRKCKRNRDQSIRYSEDEEELFTSTLNYRPPQPSPPIAKKPAVSNYHLPNPNIDFNRDIAPRTTSITSSGLSGYFTAQETIADGEHDFDTLDDLDQTIQPSNAMLFLEDSDQETIRHIDDDTDENESPIISRSSQDRHLPERVSSFRSSDSGAPRKSPFSSKSPTTLVPVPPPRISP